MSTNPWKITASFETTSSTKDEYMAVIKNLKATAPPEPKRGQKTSRPEMAHLSLIKALESRIEAIDAEQVVSCLPSVPELSLVDLVTNSEFDSGCRKCGGS